MTAIWKKGDLFKQEVGDHSRGVYGIVCAVDEEKVDTAVITFLITEYSTSALSPLVAEKMDMPEGCVPTEPQALPAAVRAQLLSILAAFRC